MVSLRDPELYVPNLHWNVVRSRIHEYWDARSAPHISIMAKTRAGKSYLIRHGILPLARYDRVLIIDVKHNDETLMGLGKPVTRMPTKMRSWKSAIREEEPEENWYRLLPPKGVRNAARARGIVGEAFERVMREGDWIVVIDELRAVTDPAHPGLHLKPFYEEFILRGGSNGIATISASQEPRWCPGCFYTQSNAMFFSRIEDQAAQKRLTEVGSQKQLMEHVQSIQNRWWLYMDDYDETGERFWARTTVKRSWHR